MRRGGFTTHRPGDYTNDPSDNEIEVYGTGATLMRELEEGGAGSTEFADVVHDIVDRARDLHFPDVSARPGQRPGVVRPPTAGTRLGGDDDIVRPVLIDPSVAGDLAVSGALFTEPVPGLTIHTDDPLGTEDRQRHLTWDTHLRTGHWARRRARLRIGASPSRLVTVLELVPKRRVRRRHRDQFVREGVAAVEILARRLERITMAPPPPR